MISNCLFIGTILNRQTFNKGPEMVNDEQSTSKSIKIVSDAIARKPASEGIVFSHILNLSQHIIVIHTSKRLIKSYLHR